MIQHYPYWLFETPVCYVVGLYANDINGGQLDDPMETKSSQYRWLIDTLQGIKMAANRKVVFLALHYPPYSGAANTPLCECFFFSAWLSQVTPRCPHRT